MHDSESDRLLSAFRSLSNSGKRTRPGIDELEARIDARRRRVRMVVAGSGAVVVVIAIALAVVFAPRGGQNVHVATQPNPVGTIAPNSQFCIVAHAIKKENATPLPASSSVAHQTAIILRQTKQLAAVAPAWLRPVIESIIASAPSSTPGDSSRSTPSAPALDPKDLELVDQTLSSCGLTLETLRVSQVAPPPVVGPDTTMAPPP